MDVVVDVGSDVGCECLGKIYDFQDGVFRLLCCFLIMLGLRVGSELVVDGWGLW